MDHPYIARPTDHETQKANEHGQDHAHGLVLGVDGGEGVLRARAREVSWRRLTWLRRSLLREEAVLRELGEEGSAVALGEAAVVLGAVVEVLSGARVGPAGVVVAGREVGRGWLVGGEERPVRGV